MRNKKPLAVAGAILAISVLLITGTALAADISGLYTWTGHVPGYVGEFTNTGTGGALKASAKINSGYGVQVRNTGQGGGLISLLGNSAYGYALYGYSKGAYATGVRGWNGTTGYGVHGASPDGIGVYGDSTNGDGVYGYSTNAVGATGITLSTDSNDAGVWGASWNASKGVHGASIFGHGGYFFTTGDSGSDAGLRVETNASSDALGVSVLRHNNHAGRFEADNNDGIYAAADGSSQWGLWGYSNDSHGVYGDTTNGTYGLFTNDKIYTGQGCVGCTSMIIAQNGSGETLEPGDVVAVVGIAEGPSEFYGRPILLVRKADTAAAQGVVGVVEGRYTTELVVKQIVHPASYRMDVPESPGTEMPELILAKEEWVEEILVQDAHASTDPAAPGERLTAVYRGLIQVKVDTSAGAIQVGDLLTAAAVSGYSIRAQLEGSAAALGTIIGKAMEPLAEGQGVIWVLVDMQ